MTETAKAAWRARVRAQRASLTDVSAPVTAHLRTFLRAQGARVVLAYRALPGEVDLSGLADDVELLTTRARWRPEPHLTLHPWASATERSRFGALQPPPDAPRIDPARVDAVLLPALAFDEAGFRLGYGGGFYDRLLAGWSVLTVGVTPEALVLPVVPREGHDVPVAFLATEQGVWRVKAV